MQLLLLGQNVCEVNRECSRLAAASSVCDSTKHKWSRYSHRPPRVFKKGLDLLDTSIKNPVVKTNFVAVLGKISGMNYCCLLNPVRNSLKRTQYKSLLGGV